ncbi:hypothetical protein Q674_16750 [Acinetobacter sp. COS3]|nr:hypothetical protein Q674_16750 [Acinetobacter sp. COS3]
MIYLTHSFSESASICLIRNPDHQSLASLPLKTHQTLKFVLNAPP